MHIQWGGMGGTTIVNEAAMNPMKAYMKAPTFEVFLQDKLYEYQKLLNDLDAPNADDLNERALLHVSTLRLGCQSYDAVKAFFQRRERFPVVNRIVAEDN